jgi:hypothetical protein
MLLKLSTPPNLPLERGGMRKHKRSVLSISYEVEKTKNQTPFLTLRQNLRVSTLFKGSEQT